MPEKTKQTKKAPIYLTLEKFTPTTNVNGQEVPEVDKNTGEPRIVYSFKIYGSYLGKKATFHMYAKDDTQKQDLKDFFEFSTERFPKDKDGNPIMALPVEIREKSNTNSDTGELTKYLEVVVKFDDLHEIAIIPAADEKKHFQWFAQEHLTNWTPDSTISKVRNERKKRMEIKNG